MKKDLHLLILLPTLFHFLLEALACFGSFRRISINYTLGSPECPWIHYFILILFSFFLSLLFQMKNIEKIYFSRNEITIKHTLLTFIPAWVVSESDFHFLWVNCSFAVVLWAYMPSFLGPTKSKLKGRRK